LRTAYVNYIICRITHTHTHVRARDIAKCELRYIERMFRERMDLYYEAGEHKLNSHTSIVRSSFTLSPREKNIFL